MANVLITGSNRGIGLELCRQFRERGETVLAACRRSSPELDRLDVRVLPGVDVAAGGSVEALAAELTDTHLDVLVHNAGMMTREGLEDLDLDAARAQFETNTLGPLRVTRALLPSLGRGTKVAIVTSLMGSMGDNGSGGYYGYRLSKAAVNMVGVNLARDLERRGILVVHLHPGMVATDMTGDRGVPVAESVQGLIARIDALGPGDSGTFWHARGDRLPW
jgi:NAD(P)-dependent dehydrogenase (short-subunit alcohol dehydrogenase family)